MADPIDLREFGRLEAMVEAQGREISEMKASIAGLRVRIDELLELANRGKGGLWVGMSIVSGVSAAIGWFGVKLTR